MALISQSVIGLQTRRAEPLSGQEWHSPKNKPLWRPLRQRDLRRRWGEPNELVGSTKLVKNEHPLHIIPVEGGEQNRHRRILTRQKGYTSIYSVFEKAASRAKQDRLLNKIIISVSSLKRTYQMPATTFCGTLLS